MRIIWEMIIRISGLLIEAFGWVCFLGFAWRKGARVLCLGLSAWSSCFEALKRGSDWREAGTEGMMPRYEMHGVIQMFGKKVAKLHTDRRCSGWNRSVRSRAT